MQKITSRLSFLSMVCVAAVLITAIGFISKLWSQESHSQPTYPQSDSSRLLFEQQLVVPVSSADSQAVIEKLQGQTVTNADGNKYRVLGVAEAARGGCYAVLENYGRVPCAEVLRWQTAQAPSGSSTEDR